MSLWILSTAALLLAADQASKSWVMAHQTPGTAMPLVAGLKLCLVHRRESGIVWRLWIAPLTLVSVAGTLLLLQVLGGFFSTRTAQIAVGSALGGAAGNVMDRLLRRGVVDFLLWGNWPVFNLADAAITVGVPLSFLLIR